MIKDLIERNRSYRRFDESAGIDWKTLRSWVDLARFSASGANRQPLKFILSADQQKNEKIFPSLGWAGYLKDWPGPKEGERPSAYIIILGDTEISKSFGVDHGIAAQSILLGAVEAGYGGCMIASIRKRMLRDALAIPNRYEILLVLALGRPVEQVQIDEVAGDGDIRYWRDEDHIHHVPKRALDDMIIE